MIITAESQTGLFSSIETIPLYGAKQAATRLVIYPEQECYFGALGIAYGGRVRAQTGISVEKLPEKVSTNLALG